MPSLTCFNIRFTPSYWSILLTIPTLALFLYLGIWQIERAHEKMMILKAASSETNKKPLLWEDGKPLPCPHQLVQLQGTYLPDIYLLDNQHHNHQFGYEVLSPLLLSEGNIVMVDRGWILGSPERDRFPIIHVPDKIQQIQGRAYFPNGRAFSLGPLLEKKANNVSILEVFDVKLLHQVLQKKVYPFIIRLDKQEPHGFVREWALVSMPPQRHFAYALQWFAMALTVFILFIVLNTQKKHEKIHV